MTVAEGLADGCITRRSDLHAHIDQLTNVGGWDIRWFNDSVTQRTALRYKIVGRLRWAGEYRSFLSKSID